MLTDPQTLTVATVAIPMPKVSTTDNRSTYSSADYTRKLLVSHSYGKRTRRTVRINREKIAPDAIFPAQNRPYGMSAYLVIDTPVNVGFTPVEIRDEVAALVLWLTAGSNANLTKVIGGEN